MARGGLGLSSSSGGSLQMVCRPVDTQPGVTRLHRSYAARVPGGCSPAVLQGTGAPK